MSGLPGKGAETRTGQSFVEDVEGFYHAVVRGALGVARYTTTWFHRGPICGSVVSHEFLTRT